MIETKRLFIRQLLISDHRALNELFGNEEVMEFSDNGLLNTEEVEDLLKEQIEGYKENSGIGIYAVEKKSTSEVIGYCGLTQLLEIDGVSEIEVGYRLIREFWGYGYATEAASAVRDYSFTFLNLLRLVALIDSANKRSIRVAKKLGMTYEKDVMMEGYDHPDHLYSMHNGEQDA